jgi:hypothetical protein
MPRQTDRPLVGLTALVMRGHTSNSWPRSSKPRISCDRSPFDQLIGIHDVGAVAAFTSPSARRMTGTVIHLLRHEMPKS